MFFFFPRLADRHMNCFCKLCILMLWGFCWILFLLFFNLLSTENGVSMSGKLHAIQQVV